MQKDTRRRIAYYQDALPHMKEKVAAAAMMLLIALIVTVTAAYAWVTLSVAPVVSSVNTTMSANGNLEIALAPPDGNLPAEFDVDESAPASTDVSVTNLQWGNLINLADDSYGIDNLVLRPAQLNAAGLSYNPLWGAQYGADGRISTLDTNYSYMTWNGLEFRNTGNYGVRAVASYKMEVSGETSKEYDTMVLNVRNANLNVNNKYAEVAEEMSSMGPMLSSFAQSKLDDVETAFKAEEIKSAYNLCKTLYDAMEAHKTALVELANFQLFVHSQSEEGDGTYNKLKWEDIEKNKNQYNSASVDAISKDGIVSLTGLTSFIADQANVKTYLEDLDSLYNAANNGTAQIYWSENTGTGFDENALTIEKIVIGLLDYASMTILVNGKEYKIPELKALVSELGLGILSLNEANAYIHNGIVARFEQMALDGGRMNGENASVNITVKFMITKTIKGKCYTKADGPSYFSSNFIDTQGVKLAPKNAIGEDTYGMAVDFWLRTNSEDTYLILEGAVATEEDGTVTSFDGINRVWGETEGNNPTKNSTTQGSGSCYIYYAETPEDMERSLDLLKSMKIAFVDDEGVLLATGTMDTQNHYAVNGRVTVPLIVDVGSGLTYTYIDETQLEQTGRAIVRMNSAEAQRITALIYLDGTLLTNENVLAAADIDGQLNIQFGSSADLETIGDNKLLYAERVVTAESDKTEMNFFDTTSQGLTAELTVHVDGDEPQNVTAYFLRAVNATQGHREKPMTFTKQSDGSWKTQYTFDAPGTYYLRYVRLDGVDYALAEPVKIEVIGFVVDSVAWGEASDEVTIYTPDDYYEETITVEFKSNDPREMPSTVQARFLSDDGDIVNINLTYNTTAAKWSGTGTFYNSGKYTMQYLLLDGEYYDITPGGFVKKLDLSLGLNVAVYNNGNAGDDGDPFNDKYDATVDSGIYAKNVGVKIFDNTGAEIKELTDVVLHYSLGASSSNTRPAVLEWNEDYNWYEGTLPLNNPGTYVFKSVSIGGNTLTKVTEAPTYRIISPDPPEYVLSESHYHDEVQFVQMKYNAYIGPITIKNSASANVEAVVYDPDGNAYTITKSDVNNAAGTMYFNDDVTVNGVNGAWYINLPRVQTAGEDTEDTADDKYDGQKEGLWTVGSISVSECYDAEQNYHDVDNPIVWTSDERDYSKLSTVVSSTVVVEMNPGDTELGDLTNAVFMSDNFVRDIGISVAVTDDEGRQIPDGTNGIGAMTLKVVYGGNTGSTEAETSELMSKYGYEVSKHSATYEISLTKDASTGLWTPANDSANWQYVGEYSVSGLDIQMSGSSSVTSYAAGTHGIPTMYTVASQAPTASNLELVSIGQDVTEFGKSGGETTGLFLASYDPLISATMRVSYERTENAQTKMIPAPYAKIPDMDVSLVLTHKGGSYANGGYTWTGTSPYETITMEMSEKTAGSMIYYSSATPMLAGAYEVSGALAVGTSTDTFEGLKDISVYSMKPSLTVNSYSYDDGSTFYCKDEISSSEADMTQNETSIKDRLSTCTNTFNNSASTESILTLHFPAVEISGTASGRTRYGLFYNNSTAEDDYKDNSRQNEVKPSISFRLVNGGNFDADSTVTFAGNQTVTWTIDSSTSVSDVQNIGALNNNDYFSNERCSGNVYWTKRTIFGTASVTQINLINSEVTYTVDLAKKFTINNPN